MDANRPSVIAFLGLLGLSLLLGWWGHARGLPWGVLEIPPIASLTAHFATLVFVATVIERATEVFVSGTRMEGSVLRKAEARTTETLESAAELATHRAQTQRFAFGLSFFLGILASLAGVSCLGPLVAPEAAAGVPLPLRLVDGLLTSLLLAGGADGIHQVVAVLTDFLEKRRDLPGLNPTDGRDAAPAGAPIPGTAAAPVPRALKTVPKTAHVHDPGA